MKSVLVLAGALTLLTGGQSFAASAWPDRYNDCLGFEDPDDALAACQDALSSPALSVLERSEVFRQMGAVYRVQGALMEAEANLRASLSLVPENPETLAEMGAVFYLKEEFEAASDYFSRALDSGFPSAVAHNNRAMTFLVLGDVANALADFDAAVSLSEKNGAIWNNRANARCSAGNVEGAYLDRIQALYNGRFTAAAAQTGLRKGGFYDGPSDGIWGFDSEQALRAWTAAGCPDPPKSRLQ